MKTIGLIGGMSWESTSIYYRYINQSVRQKMGGLHSAKILLWSFDFEEIAYLQSVSDWAAATQRMVTAGNRLKMAGADCLVICTNTMHKVAEEVERQVGLPLLHIVDATAEVVKDQGVKKVGLLATRFTMEHDFYRDRMQSLHGITTLVPDESMRDDVHRIIYEQLCRGIVDESSRQRFHEIIRHLQDAGAQGVVLGCTEVGLLVKQADISIPVFDSTFIHSDYAAAWALLR